MLVACNTGLMPGLAILAATPDTRKRINQFTPTRHSWTSEMGSVDNAGDFQALLSYSPYHNLKAGTAYPPTLITTGDHDDRRINQTIQAT